MTKRVRRNHSPACEAAVDELRSGIGRGEEREDVADLARQFDVHVNQITPLRRAREEGAACGRGRRSIPSLEPRPAPLQRWL
jgi:transposase-like protein